MGFRSVRPRQDAECSGSREGLREAAELFTEEAEAYARRQMSDPRFFNPAGYGLVTDDILTVFSLGVRTNIEDFREEAIIDGADRMVKAIRPFINRVRA